MLDTLYVDSSDALSHCWGLGNRLSVYPHHTRSMKSAASEGSINEIKWGVSMCSNEFMRRLAKSSYELNEDMDEAKAMHLTAQCELVQRLELIWHLAELLLIQVFPPGYLAYSLCSWFHVQSQDAADDARILLEQFNGNSTQRGNSRSAVAEQDEKFWPTVLALILQARSHEAATALALHSHANSRGLRSLRQLLVAMPIMSQTETAAGHWNTLGTTFSQAWNYWQSECRRRLREGEFDHVGGVAVSLQYVHLIVSVLAGDQVNWEDERIIRATNGPHTWYFRFVASLFYTDQMIAVDGLSAHLDRWLASSKGVHGSTLDKVVNILVSSVFQLDFQSFIRTASEKLENWWLVAHFTNLLNHVYPDLLFNSEATTDSSVLIAKPEEMAGIESRPSASANSSSSGGGNPSLADFFVIGYAEALSTDLTMLSVALGYLDYCETGAMRQSALLLAHGNPGSTRAVNWFMHQADRRNLQPTSEQLARVAARRLLPLVSSGERETLQYLPSCAAMGWALQAKDYGSVNWLAVQTLARDQGLHLDEASSPATPLPTEIAEVAAIVLSYSNQLNRAESVVREDSATTTDASCFRLSPELTFLVRYAELQPCFNNGNIVSAVDRLIDLLVSGCGTSSATVGASTSATLSSQYTTSCSRISTRRLRLRLLSEVRHLLGRRCLRRDQVEWLIAALVDLQSERVLGGAEVPLFSQLHALLARELSDAFLYPIGPSTVLLRG